MAMNLIRDAPFGQLARYITKNRVFRYPEEEPGYEFPPSYLENIDTSRRESDTENILTDQSGPVADHPDFEKQRDSRDGTDADVAAGSVRDIEKISTRGSENQEHHHIHPVSSHIARTKSLPYTEARLHQDEEAAIERAESRPIAPTRTADGMILVDWYSTDDPDNPQVNMLDFKNLSPC